MAKVKAKQPSGTIGPTVPRLGNDIEVMQSRHDYHQLTMYRIADRRFKFQKRAGEHSLPIRSNNNK